MARTTARGTCALCGYGSTKAGMTRHLKSCSSAHDGPRGRTAKLWQLRIEDAYSAPYWLDIEVKANATLADLDAFLRGVWLECCGHLSAFDINRRRYTVDYELDYGVDFLRDPDERTMKVKVAEVLAPDLKFMYEYDFGSTTELTLRVTGEREGRIGPSSLRLLARNDVPSWPCRVCGEAATQLHTEEMYDDENPFYCDTHAVAWGDEWAFLPVVNSPRMGGCAATPGGSSNLPPIVGVGPNSRFPQLSGSADSGSSPSCTDTSSWLHHLEASAAPRPSAAVEVRSVRAVVKLRGVRAPLSSVSCGVQVGQVAYPCCETASSRRPAPNVAVLT